MKASDIMTRDVVAVSSEMPVRDVAKLMVDHHTVPPDAPIATIAETMESHHIKRLLVVEGGKVVGIVSRANLVQALATVAPIAAEAARMDDEKIHDTICAEVEKIAWGPSPVMNNVTVHDGVVHLWGYVSSENERKALRIAAGRVVGVKEVRDHRSDLLPKSQ
jgi:CBS domain-containing protein